MERAKWVRLNFLYFEGDNPIAWCFKVNQYFEYHQTQPIHKLLVASYHLLGEAMIWYQDAIDNDIFNNWDNFVEPYKSVLASLRMKNPWRP